MPGEPRRPALRPLRGCGGAGAARGLEVPRAADGPHADGDDAERTGRDATLLRLAAPAGAEDLEADECAGQVELEKYLLWGMLYRFKMQPSLPYTRGYSMRRHI